MLIFAIFCGGMQHQQVTGWLLNTAVLYLDIKHVLLQKAKVKEVESSLFAV